METADGYVIDVDYIPGFLSRRWPRPAMRHVAALNRLRPPPDCTMASATWNSAAAWAVRSPRLAAANPAGPVHGSRHQCPPHGRHRGGRRRRRARQRAGDHGRFRHAARRPRELRLHHHAWRLELGLATGPAGRARRSLKKRLAPGGLFFVSYNAMPGWAHLQPIKGILQQYAALRTGRQPAAAPRRLGLPRLHPRQTGQVFRGQSPGGGLCRRPAASRTSPTSPTNTCNEHWTSFYFAEVAAAFRGSRAGLCRQPAGLHQLLGPLREARVSGTLPHHQRPAGRRGPQRLLCQHGVSLGHLRQRATADGHRRGAAAEVDDLWFGLVRQDLQLPYRANLGVVTSTVQGPLYQALHRRAGWWQPAGFRSFLPGVPLPERKPEEIVRAADAGVAMGMFEVTAGPVPPPPAELPAAVTIPLAFNRTILETAAWRPAGGAWRAGDRHGSQIGDLEAAILLDLTERGRRALPTGCSRGLAPAAASPAEDGKPVTDVPTQKQIVERGCDTFRQARIPQLVATDILEPA